MYVCFIYIYIIYIYINKWIIYTYTYHMVIMRLYYDFSHGFSLQYTQSFMGVISATTISSSKIMEHHFHWEKIPLDMGVFFVFFSIAIAMCTRGYPLLIQHKYRTSLCSIGGKSSCLAASLNGPPMPQLC